MTKKQEILHNKRERLAKETKAILERISRDLLEVKTAFGQQDRLIKKLSREWCIKSSRKEWQIKSSSNE